MGSSTQLEIHIASNYVLKNDPTVSRDSDLDLWGNFPCNEAEEKWIKKYIKKLDAFAKKIREKYPEQFEAEQNFALHKYREKRCQEKVPGEKSKEQRGQNLKYRKI